MTQPLWTPAPAAVANSQLTAFSSFASRSSGKALPDYAALHKWSIENPRCSYLWCAPIVKRLCHRPSVTICKVDQCRFGLSLPNDKSGQRIKKPTTIIANFEGIGELGLACCCKHSHVDIRGPPVKHEGRKVKRTWFAGRYPQGLCHAWVRAAYC